jgi:hypothetical protein
MNYALGNALGNLKNFEPYVILRRLVARKQRNKLTSLQIGTNAARHSRYNRYRPTHNPAVAFASFAAALLKTQ